MFERDVTHPGRMFDFAGWLYHQNEEYGKGTVTGLVSTLRTELACVTGWKYKESVLYTKALGRMDQRKLDAPRRFRDPATRRLIVGVMRDESIDLGLRVAILIGFVGLFRVSEYTAGTKWKENLKFNTLTQDLKFEYDAGGQVVGFSIRVKRSKGDRYNNGGWQSFARNDSDELCPVKWMLMYRKSRLEATMKDLPLFVRQRQGTANPRSWSRVTSVDINEALKKVASSLGIDPTYVSSHSLRIGGAFTLADANVPLHLIRVRGGWTGERWEAIVMMYSRMSSSRLYTIAKAFELAPESVPLRVR